MATDPGRSLLSRNKILEHIKAGNIVINPFDERNLKTTSYDVRLGAYHYREVARGHGAGILNPFDKEHIERHWQGPKEGVNAADWMKEHECVLNNIKDDDRLIVIAPGETILAHTEEFIGGRHCIGQEMRARSSMGRIGITVCKCAGWGDIGYINRWTMEITNHLKNHSIPLVVGMRLAQIIFMQVDPLTDSYAGESGKYQATDDLEALMSSWHPSAMVPKLYKDYELTEGFPKFREFAIS